SGIVCPTWISDLEFGRVIAVFGLVGCTLRGAPWRADRSPGRRRLTAEGAMDSSPMVSQVDLISAVAAPSTAAPSGASPRTPGQSTFTILPAPDSPESQLLEARLGIASSLFTALRYRHAPTAAHSLRVTLSCASWALAMGMTDEQRDLIEVAALLH